MSSIVKIRPCRPDDAIPLLEVFYSAIGSATRDYSPAQIKAWATDRDLQSWGERLQAKPTYVAERSGVIAGMSDLECDGHVDMLYVHPLHQRCGVACALLAHVENQARARGLARLYTEASLTARSTFQRQGFDVVTSQTVSFNGETFLNFQMVKLLD